MTSPNAQEHRRSKHAGRRRRDDAPQYVLIIDTETRVNIGQGLMYGGFWFCTTTTDGRLCCLEEGLLHADNLRKPPRRSTRCCAATPSTTRPGSTEPIRRPQCASLVSTEWN
jgi:hypothetical protein